jgi:hypothetical protein
MRLAVAAAFGLLLTLCLAPVLGLADGTGPASDPAKTELDHLEAIRARHLQERNRELPSEARAREMANAAEKLARLVAEDDKKAYVRTFGETVLGTGYLGTAGMGDRFGSRASSMAGMGQRARSRAPKRSLLDIDRYLDNTVDAIKDEKVRWLVVTGGERITQGAVTSGFPDCVAVGNKYEFCCTGTLVGRNVVITAGHCFDCCNEDLGGRVFIGTDVTASRDDNTYKVLKAIRHPNYKKDGKRNDLTVLILDKDVPATVKPRKFADPNTLARSNLPGTDMNVLKYVFAVGFGNTDFAGATGYGTKRMGVLPLVPLSKSDTDAALFGCDSGLEFVAGAKSLDIDTCTGDSGGPVYVERGDDWLLAGATSRAVRGADRECGDGGIYVRLDVADYVQWVRSLPGTHWDQ